MHKLDENLFVTQRYINSERIVNSIGSVPKLTHDEQQRLFMLLHADRTDKKVRDLLILSNIGLAIKIANKFQSAYYEYQDIISDAIIGLIIAVDRFDVNHGCAFKTYAPWWISQNIRKTIYNTARMIRLPIYVEEQIQRINDVSDEEDGLDEKTRRLMNIKKTSEVLILQRNPPMDLDYPTITDTIYIKQVTNMILNCLDKQKRDVIKRNFGIGYDQSQTLQAIGNTYGLTRERIRQYHMEAMNKIKALFAGIGDFSNGVTVYNFAKVMESNPEIIDADITINCPGCLRPSIKPNKKDFIIVGESLRHVLRCKKCGYEHILTQ